MKNVTLTAKTIASIGLCQPVAEVSMATEDELPEMEGQCLDVRITKAMELPEHLVQLFKCCLLEDQSMILKKMLCEFCQLFSSGPCDLGSMIVMKH